MSWEVVLSRIGLSGFDDRGMMAAGLRSARRYSPASAFDLATLRRPPPPRNWNFNSRPRV